MMMCRTKTTLNVLVAWCAVGIIGLAGCHSPQADSAVATKAEQKSVSAEPQVMAPIPIEPQLTSVGDAQLTLFGEFPDRQRVPFQAQAASPMKQHTFESEGADFDVCVSPNGKSMVFASTRHYPRPKLYLKSIDGRAVTQLTDDTSADVQPCFSADGKLIAFASNRSGNWDIWTIGLQAGRATQITQSPQHEVHPTFSPDGKHLAYCQFNNRTSQWELWVVNLAQPDSRRMIGLGLFPEWSPTADSIVYQRARERGGRWFSIWRIDLDNGEPRFPVELAASSEMALIQPSWSPDGEWVTYGTAQVGAGSDLPEESGSSPSRGDIWIMRADGSSPMQMTDGSGVNFGSVWGSDDRVYFSSRQNGRENVWSVRPNIRGSEKLNTAALGAKPGSTSANVPTPGVAQSTGKAGHGG